MTLAGGGASGQTGPMISEFMAVNTRTLADEDGDFPDWIEIWNPGEQAISLDGWHLTDDADDLTQWTFPNGVVIEPNGLLVVFASGKDRRDPLHALHTRFKLDGDGEYLALVAADGVTVMHEYSPQYPRQTSDISYGLMRHVTALVAEGATASYRVPSTADSAAEWTSPTFNDTAWDKATTALGFGAGGRSWVCYNDCVYAAGQAQASHVTTYGTGNGFPGRSTGPLLDQDTGEPAGVTVAITQNGGVGWQSVAASGGRDSDPGTDAYETFGGLADMAGVVYYGSEGWWVDLTFIGLDPGAEYTFAASAARAAYDDRVTIFSIRGADTYTNASTPGVKVLGPDQVSFNTGGNVKEGYVARWTGIRASKGSFTVRAEADPSSPQGRAYAFSVFMLEAKAGSSDVQARMMGVNTSFWSRLPFDLDEGQVSLSDRLMLRIRYEDGFVAYLNGQEVARRNALVQVQWNSAAASNRPAEQALAYEQIDLTGFKDLFQTGRNVLAVQGLNDAVSDGDFFILPELIATQDVLEYFSQPTPGRPNVAGSLGRVAEVGFSHSRGFYQGAFELAMSTETQGAQILFTRDGSQPSAAYGEPYTSPLVVDRSSVIRAVGVKPGYLDSRTATSTYIFLSDVPKQSPKGEIPGFGWSGGLSYGMDPAITGNAVWGPQMARSLTSIPTVSIVTDLANLFDPQRGIYVNAGNYGAAWERPVSVELIYPSNPAGPGFPDLVQVPEGAGGAEWALPADMQEGFQINAGLRIRGGYSRYASPKHGLRVFFRGEYGDGELKYRLFGDEGLDRFDCVDLRTSQNYSWASAQDPANTMCRDVWARDTQGQAGQPYTRSRYYHLYLNGQYWGLYMTEERPEASYGASYWGGSPDDYDCIKAAGPNGNPRYSIEATDGTMDCWQQLWEMSMRGFGDSSTYYRAQGLNLDGTQNSQYPVLLDVDNLIDDMLIIFYDGDLDAPISNFLGNNQPNNWYGLRNRHGDKGFIYFVHDAEHILSRGGTNRTGPFPAGDQLQYSSPQWIHQELMAHPDYRMRFADLAYRRLFNDGLLTSSQGIKRFLARASQIDMAIIAESARWGSASLHKGTWQLAINTEVQGFFPSRTQTVINQLKQTRLRSGAVVPLYPAIDPPRLSLPSGSVAKGQALSVTAPKGVTYYTLDGSDPRVAAALSGPGALVTLVPENAPKRVRVPLAPEPVVAGSILAEYWTGLQGTAVSDLTGVPEFPSQPSAQENLYTFAIATNRYENYGARVRGYLAAVQSGSYTFWIASSAGALLWLSTDENLANKVLIAQVSSQTGPQEWDKSPEQRSRSIDLVAGQRYYIEALHKGGSGGDHLAVAWQTPTSSRQVISGRFLSPAGRAWTEVDYDDKAWRSGEGGVGYDRNPADAANYLSLISLDIQADVYGKTASCYVRIPFTLTSRDLVTLALKARYDDGFIVYLNGAEILQGNLDSKAMVTWNTAAQTSRPGRDAIQFQRFDLTRYLGLLRTGKNVLAIHALNAAAADDDMLLCVELEGNAVSQGEVSPAAVRQTGPIELGRSVQVKARALDGQWSALAEGVFSVGPVAESLRITEIMYHPGPSQDPNAEYIELQNVGTVPINLNLVSFAAGIEFTFSSLDLGPGDRTVVVQDLAAFEAAYGTGIPVAGVFSGRLSDGGERIVLKDAIGSTILDFEYADNWYGGTDAGGLSLTIVDASYPEKGDGSLKSAWRGSTPSPGRAGL